MEEESGELFRSLHTDLGGLPLSTFAFAGRFGISASPTIPAPAAADLPALVSLIRRAGAASHNSSRDRREIVPHTTKRRPVDHLGRPLSRPRPQWGKSLWPVLAVS